MTRSESNDNVGGAATTIDSHPSQRQGDGVGISNDAQPSPALLGATALTKLPLNRIHVGKRLRAVDPKGVEQLAESMAATGLTNPITITPGRCLVAGAHRLAAVKRLGSRTIPVRVLKLNDTEAEIVAHMGLERSASCSPQGSDAEGGAQ